MHVSSTPHVRAKSSTTQIMLTVIIALLPAAVFGVHNFGIRALWHILITVSTCILSELVFDLITKRKVLITDFSAVVTGLLLAMNLPVAAPLWIGFIGGFFAIIVVKMLFGGLGQNFMNPALGARCFLLISFPKFMTNFTYDGVSSATPLAVLKSGGNVELKDMIFGNTGGTIGETSMLFLVLGGCIMIMAGVIDMYVTASYILSFIVFLILCGGKGFDPYYIACQLAGGGLMLGAFFMATDYATRPVTKKGQVIYGIFIGIMTGVFRIFGPSAEGVSYAIILGNLVTPLIEKITMPKPFGYEKPVKEKKGGKA
ncbi:MAG: RnfABCDGE type electron transport complex subunit D [Lachnospiraceae bacterium]|nr:RnfABCDGE type electron transport complex subunit D [Lachnospiraceae bacterium]